MTRHAVEHFGLGRYGDNLDYEGRLKEFRLISQLVAPGGTLLCFGADRAAAN
jgi:hypothetical protein